MTNSIRAYNFSQQAESAPPRFGKGVTVFVVLFGALCLAGFILRQPLLESAGAYFFSPRPVEPLSTDSLPPGLTDDERLMYTLTHVGGEPAREAVETIIEKNDQRYTAVLIEALATNEVTRRFYPTAGPHHYFRALMHLIGDPSLAPDSQNDALSRKFMEWYAGTDLVAPDGYINWKSELLGRVDPVFTDLIYDGVPTRIRLEEVRSGGVAFDGIPALDQPGFLPAGEAASLDPKETVFGIVINGDARAYPESILQWHEMANDVVGEVPVTLAYCTLCGAAIAYDGRTSEGTISTFGSSGLLYRSNKLMYDRQTRSLWNHLTGEPVVGQLADSGIRLERLSVVTTTWGDWWARHPQTKVLDPNTGFKRTYQPGAAYGRYFASSKTMFPVGSASDRLPAKSRVYGLRLGGRARAYPLTALAAEKVVNDSLGGVPVVLVATRGTITVNGVQMLVRNFTEPVTFDAGGEVRVFQAGEQTFHPGPDADTLEDQQGHEWKVTAEGLVYDNETHLPRINGVQSYWFAWYEFNEDTDVYRTADEEP